MSDMIDPVMGLDCVRAGARNRCECRDFRGCAACGDRSGQQRLTQELVRQAKEQGTALTGSGGSLAGLTKQVLEAQMVGHLGYEVSTTQRAVTAGIPAKRPSPELPGRASDLLRCDRALWAERDTARTIDRGVGSPATGTDGDYPGPGWCLISARSAA
jgi:hypothetical protein